ncbi:MAG: hypothetical protein WBB01_03705 [Phormidesmis sp.]
MVNPPPPSGENSPAMLAAEAELLQAVLDSDRYPWLTGDAVDDEAQLEAAGQPLEISDDEASQGWQRLSQQLSVIWGTDEAQSPLQQKFAGRLPAAMMAHITEKAQQVAHQAQAAGTSRVSQMIFCVQDMLTQLGEADLQVMARPMALAMRGSSSEEFVEAAVQSVRVADWDELSPIEQGRLSLAAARYAIAQAEHN